MRLVTLTFLVYLAAQRVSSKSTTPNIQEVFEGRCLDYTQGTTYLANPLPRSVGVNCSTIWQTFSKAFAYIDPKDVAEDNYTDFINSAQQTLTGKKIMFWAHTQQLARRYSRNGVQFILLDYTLIGYLADKLNWCGDKNTPDGLNYTKCPKPNLAMDTFWAAVSKWFARQATGEVTVMLDGSKPANQPAFNILSDFAQYELPNLDATKVTAVNAIVVHSFNKRRVEDCNQGSLILLKNRVVARGFKFSCVDNPDAVLHLLCSDDPTNKNCRLVKNDKQSIVQQVLTFWAGVYRSLFSEK